MLDRYLIDTRNFSHDASHRSDRLAFGVNNCSGGFTVGFQAGGQAYKEIIFFKNKEAMDRFKDNKFEVAAQVSAVAATKGASADAKYNNGVMIYTMQKGGLMYEASVGGQKLKFNPF